MTSPDILIPLTIFLARLAETSLETIRTVYISRGYQYLSAGVGVIKVAFWLLSTGLVLTNLNNIWGILAYITGYGVGTIIGMEIEERISIGNVVVRIISGKDPQSLMTRLKGMGYGVTRLEGSGYFSPEVSVLLMIVPRKELSLILEILKNEYPDLLYTVEDVRKASDGGKIFHGKRSKWLTRFFGW